MANYVQSNNSVSSAYQQFFLSKVPIGDDYLIFATDDYYICVHGDYDGTEFSNSTLIKISRSYGNQGSVSYSTESSTTVNIKYEYYSYSNIGTGSLLVSPLQSINNFKSTNYIFISVFAFLLLFVGFNVIKKRWIR